MKVILVHDWLTGYRGGERVLEQIALSYPDSSLYTLVYREGEISPKIEDRRIITPFINNFKLYRNNYRYFLPAMPALINTFKPEKADLVISTSHCIAKAFPTPPGSIHISYVHSPMRYIYDQFPHYFNPGQANLAVRTTMSLMRPYLALWDRNSNNRVTQFVANSKHVAKRIKRYWNRDAIVVHPPVNIDLFTPGATTQENDGYFLIVSALVAYKRVDLAIRAANRLKFPLMVVGGGSDELKLRQLAGPTVQFRSWTSPQKLVNIIRGCKAFLFPGEEDFGIAPVEAMACGKPVIAYGVGGVRETVAGKGESDHPTGIFFDNQNVESVIEAIKSFNPNDFKVEDCQKRAEKFSAENFRKNWNNVVNLVLDEHRG